MWLVMTASASAVATRFVGLISTNLAVRPMGASFKRVFGTRNATNRVWLLPTGDSYEGMQQLFVMLDPTYTKQEIEVTD